jgi:ribosomal protein S12 methylthiotransferase accessory factor
VNIAASAEDHERTERPIGAAEALLFSSEVLQRFGITRVGDVTGLDVIGLPVWFACRPNSRSLSVAQGKGTTHRQARISAVMEAIEAAVAERPRSIVGKFGSIEEMRGRGEPLVPFAALARSNVQALDPMRQRAWVSGYSMTTGGEILAPYELIGMDMRTHFPWDRTAFHMSSQGLAAGFDFDSAVLHALLELVEHDASFMVDMFDMPTQAGSRLMYQPGVHAGLDKVMAKLDHAGIRPSFHDLTTGFDLPVVAAVIARNIQSPSGPITRPSAGLACRLNAADAALAALLEAIQSRLTDISGARDDLPEERYRTHGGAVSPARQSADLVDRDLGLAGAESTPIWRRVGARLIERGAEDVLLFPLASGVEGIHVVRVLVPGLAAASGAMDEFSLSSLSSFLGKRGEA